MKGREWHDRFLSPGVRTSSKKPARHLARIQNKPREGRGHFGSDSGRDSLRKIFHPRQRIATKPFGSGIGPKREPIRILLWSAVAAIHKSQLAIVMQREGRQRRSRRRAALPSIQIQIQFSILSLLFSSKEATRPSPTNSSLVESQLIGRRDKCSVWQRRRLRLRPRPEEVRRPSGTEGSIGASRPGHSLVTSTKCSSLHT